MAIYFVGDIQGCYEEFNRLLDKIKFDPLRDELWIAGDMIARGSDSLATMKLILSLGESVKAVLGNHDLHFLSTVAGLFKVKKKDNLANLIDSPELPDIIAWMKQQPLVRKLPNKNVYMSHAGLPPQWTPELAYEQSQKAQLLISADDNTDNLQKMYGNRPSNWLAAETSVEQFRFTVNALTRMRYCHLDGSLDFDCKVAPNNAPRDLKPWFEFNHLQEVTWIFGHWASLLGHCNTKNVYALDTGCVWGHHLTILKWPDKTLFTEPSRQ